MNGDNFDDLGFRGMVDDMRAARLGEYPAMAISYFHWSIDRNSKGERTVTAWHNALMALDGGWRTVRQMQESLKARRQDIWRRGGSRGYYQTMRLFNGFLQIEYEPATGIHTVCIIETM